MSFIPNDTYFTSQWHLRNATTGEFDLNVVDVWDDYTGSGVTVTVIDDGFDYNHPDISPNYQLDKDYDFGGTPDANAAPESDSDNHGTPVMGILGAAQNGSGVVGVAFESNLIGFRHGNNLLGQIAATEATFDSSNANYQATDVVSMSFGENTPFYLVLKSFHLDLLDNISQGNAIGRGGLGTVYVKSAGNGRLINNDNANAEMVDASPYTITVAAALADGSVANYSSPGASVTVSAFGSPLAGTIFTTDRLDTEGNNENTSANGGDYEPAFNGTSAATPMVSGVVALMLDANSQLGWRDVQTILSYSARHVGSDVGAAAAGDELTSGAYGSTQSWLWNNATNWNGGGLHFSNDYGFGLVDAKAAVRLAETWHLSSTSGNQFVTHEDDVDGSTLIADGGFGNFTINETLNAKIEHVSLELAFSADALEDLEVYLTSPSGTTSKLIAGTGGADAFNDRWTFSSNAFRGETSAGDWILQVRDGQTDGQRITVTDALLSTFGSSATSSDDLFILTNEFSNFAGIAGHGTTFNGGDSGTDIFNASAVDANSYVNLFTKAGVVDGITIATSNIDIVYTGDGNDTIVGDAEENKFFSGRGDDELFGGIGADTLNGEFGNDTLEGGPGNDSLFGRDGNDTFQYRNGEGAGSGERVEGGAGDDRFLIGSDAGATFDFRGLSVLSIEELEFDNGIGSGDNTAVFNAEAFDTVTEFSFNLIVDGIDAADRTEQIDIHMGSVTVLNISGWTFQDWGGQDERITVHGDADGEMITGTTERDVLLGGGGNDTLLGGNGDDELLGGQGVDLLFAIEGNDTLDGGAGADSLFGGTGNNVFIVDNLGDAVSESGGGGIDKVESSIDFTLGAGLENLDLTGAGSINGTGNGLANTINGNSGSNILDGVGGDDSLFGDGDNDTLNGGSGNDTLNGGSGDDRMVGGLGDDVFYLDSLGDTIVEDNDQGTDTIKTTLSNLTLADFANVENIEMDQSSGGSSTNGINSLSGNEMDNKLVGDSGNDSLSGSDGNDTLIGDAGNDTLNGGVGADSMVGGLGNDTYSVNSAGDVVSESGGGGLDKVVSSVSFLLAAGLENLSLTGAGNISGTGNGLKNVLIGNGGNNTLKGANGNDTLKGGSGNDKLFGGKHNDKLFGLNQNDTLKGDAGKDQLNGGGSNDKLNGGSGKDTLKGGSGKDQFWGDAGNDRIIGGSGTDTANYSGNIGRYDVVKAGSKIKVIDTTGKLGTDVLSGVEKLKFGGTIYKIKQALKLAGPDPAASDSATNDGNNADDDPSVPDEGNELDVTALQIETMLSATDDLLV